MNLFQLEYFVILAETLSYTKASQKMHISQSTLSKMIINLEHVIGSQLFIRNKRDVKLTPAGKVFYDEIKKTLSTYEGAVKKVQEMENGSTGVINLGFLGTALFKSLPRIIRNFKKAYPTVQLNAVDYGYAQMMECLSDGQIDVALIPDLELDTIPNLTKKIIATDKMCVVVPKNHRIADLDSVELATLKDEPIITMDIKASRRDHNFITKICREHDFLPNIITEARTLLNILVLVECSIGISIMAAHMEDFAPNTVRFIPIENYEQGFRIACIHKDPDSLHIKNLLKVIDEYYNINKTTT